RLRIPLVDPEPPSRFQGPVDRPEAGDRLLPMMEGKDGEREVELLPEREIFDRASLEDDIRKWCLSGRAANHGLGFVESDDRQVRVPLRDEVVQLPRPAAD